MLPSARYVLLGALLCSALPIALGSVTLFDLNNGAGAPAEVWTLQNANQSVTVTDVSLPGYVLEVLEARKLIPDPLIGYNERALNWVRDDTWTFSRAFKLDAPWTGGELVLAGVDTVADVTLNGRPLALVDNEFRTHRLPLAAADLAGPGPHKIAVTLKPVKAEAEKRQAEYPYSVPSTAHVGSFAEHKGFIRKAGADFGWDWGPALGPVGIFGDIYLLADGDATKRTPVASAGSYMQAAHIRQLHKSDGMVRLTAHLVVARPASSSNAALEGTARLAIPELGVDVSKVVAQGSSDGATCRTTVSAQRRGPGARLECDVLVEVDVPKSKVSLWWPAGHGPQTLYASTVTWQPKEVEGSCQEAAIYNTDAPAPAKEAAGSPLSVSPRVFGCSVARRSVGFRTVELVTEPLAVSARELAPARAAEVAVSGATDAAGESMYLRVNGVAMFMKGANLIPFHTIRTQVSEQMVDAVLQGTVDANMNILRVWGGGIYQPDSFYDKCDRMGIMVWQEAMFGCAMYPADDAFLGEVRKEMTEQVLRIGHHPSLVVWGGNNENEIAFNWYPETKANPEFYRKDYVKLYFDTVGDVLTKLDPERPFIDSSPANGPFYTGATADGKLSAPLADKLKVHRWSAPGAAKYGDVHFYNHVDDCTAPDVVPVSKVLSEFGWQSDAPYFTIKHVTEPKDWDTWAPGAQYRQRWNEDGTRIKTEQMRKLFGGLPAHNFEADTPEKRAELYGDWIYLRQVHQAVCYDHTVSLLRRMMRDPKHGSMGALYWQINDVWQGASWSSMDYEMRWKPTHYALRSAFAPVQVQALLSPPVSATTKATPEALISVELTYDEAGPLPVPVDVGVYLHSLSGEPAATSKGAAHRGGSHGKSTRRDADLVHSFTVPAGAELGVRAAWSSSVEKLMGRRPGCSVESCYVRVVARDAKASSAGPQPAIGAKERRGLSHMVGFNGEQEQVIMFAKPDALSLPAVTVTPSAFRQVGPRLVEFNVTVCGGAAVHAFWDADPAGVFQPNNFNVLRPNAAVTVRFEARQDVTAAQVEKTLKVWTLNGALQGRQRQPPAVSSVGSCPTVQQADAPVVSAEFRPTPASGRLIEDDPILGKVDWEHKGRQV